MKKSFLTILTISSILISCGDEADDKHESNIKFKDLIGNTYEFRYEEYIYHIKLESDSTVFWKLVEGDYEGPSEETDTYIHSKVNNQVHFISWTEDSGLELFNVLDFENSTLYTHGNADGHMFVNPGTIKLLE